MDWAAAIILLMLSINSGRITLMVARGGSLSSVHPARATLSTIAGLPCQIVLAIWMFLHMPWYIAFGLIVVVVFAGGMLVNRRTLLAAWSFQPGLDLIVIAGSAALWGVSLP